ncbi:PQQ-binding-like beta-propeller repeat protein [Flavobacterium sp. ENC]|uniref:outer membrane protein assembly factor BamB family protein n=1 Tax=Flavobacterium sp. ENC TaxID=2897330 RepID=UPI001E5CF371|nr:PQQ-binding-like beta-propeller repeat protein [Flavobacterium sp. ENC]MCD0466933.1 PQQ-binding-like beta-propeller repeat protein [Flavobacterium sp. ENC]
MKKKLILLLFAFTVINTFGQVPATANTGSLFSNKVVHPVAKVPLDEASILIYDYDGSLFSFDLESEQIGWTVKATDAHTEMCANQLTLQDGVVYVPFINGEIFAIDNMTGDVFWKSRLGNTTDQIVLKDQTPVINNGKLYITSQGQNSTIYALNIKDGSLAWSHKLDDASNAVSVLFFNNKVFTQSGSNLYSFDAGTGKLLNQKTFEEAISGKPVTDDENIFIANEKDVVYALSPDKLDVLWQFKIEENQHNIKDRIFSKNKKVYFAAQGETVSSLYAVDSKTGTQLWKTDFKNDNVQYITEKDDNLWGYTRKGKLFQLDIDNGETAFEAKLTTNPISNLEFPDDDSLFYYSDAALIQFEYKTKDENEVYLRTSIKDDVYNAYIKVLRP